MKIILKNSQLKKLKSFINEAELDNTKKTILGQKLLKFYNLLSVNKSIEFILSSGTKVVLRCTKASGDNFEFEILKDDTGALKQWDSLSIKINIGDKKNVNFVEKYEKNKNVITPTNKNDGSFNLIFDASNDKGEKNKANFNKVKNILQSNLKVKDKKLNEPTNQEPTDKQPTNSGEGMVNKADAKAAYDRILNDPKLKDAFYKQPNFWKMFTAELKGEKPTGSGIVTALDILDKYDLRRYNEKINSLFNIDESVKIVFTNDVLLKKDDKQIKFSKNIPYSFVVSRSKEKNKTVLRYKNDSSYYLVIEKTLKDKNDSTGDFFNTKIDGVTYEFKILTGPNESPGYNSEQD